MARYSRRAPARSARRTSYASKRRPATGRTYATRSPSRRRSTARRSTGSRQQVIRIEVVQSPENAVARPPIGMKAEAAGITPAKSKF